MERLDDQRDVAVVIPAYNEERTIAAVVQAVRAQASHVIVVDDGSQDGTAACLEGLDVVLVRHGDNRGKGAALMTGFRVALEAGAAGVVTLDGDGQHRAEDLPRLVAAARDNPRTIIIGSRLHDRAAFPPARLKANETANFWISWAAGHAVSDSQSGFRYYPADLLRRLKIRHGRQRSFVVESEILIKAAKLGYHTIAVPIPALYDGTLQRPSHFRPVADITRIVLMVAWHLISRGMYPQGLLRVLRSQGNRAGRLL